jgi:hypothetical protein
MVIRSEVNKMEKGYDYRKPLEMDLIRSRMALHKQCQEGKLTPEEHLIKLEILEHGYQLEIDNYEEEFKDPALEEMFPEGLDEFEIEYDNAF